MASTKYTFFEPLKPRYMVKEIKLNHSALVMSVRNFFWVVLCHHNKENICKWANACEKKNTSYNTALRLWKVSNDRIETGFYSKVETAKRRSKSSFWRVETSKQPAILRCMPSNQGLFCHCSFEVITIKTCRKIPNHFRIDCASHTCLSFSRSACISIALGLLLLD